MSDYIKRAMHEFWRVSMGEKRETPTQCRIVEVAIGGMNATQYWAPALVCSVDTRNMVMVVHIFTGSDYRATVSVTSPDWRWPVRVAPSFHDVGES